jgi:hypothetical protein
MPVAKKTPSLPARPQKNKYKSSWDDIVSGAIVAGLFYGLLMDKGVSSLSFKGESMLNAFQFRSLALFKYYFLAVGASLIFMALIYYFSITRLFFNDSKRSLRTPKSSISLIIGSILSGAGMILAGSDFAFLLVQAGCGFSSAKFALGGAVFGTILFSLVGDKFFGDLVRVEDTMETSIIGKPYYLSALIVGGATAFVGLILEAFSSYYNELEMIPNSPTFEGYFSMFYDRSWSPITCGVFVGFMQLVMVVIVSEGSELKDAFLPIVSQITRINKKLFEKEDFPLLHKKKNVTAMNFWQFLFAVGIYFGGFLSTWLTENSKFHRPNDIGSARAAIGGILLMFGAQITGATICGHMLSGIGHLSINSVISILFSFTTAFGVASLF